MTKAKSPPALLTLILLTAFAPLTLNMFLPSLANIATDLQTSYRLASLSISGYLAITALINLIIGPLSDRFGRRPVLLVALVIFAGASMVCALANNIWVFLAFRVLQGAMAAGYALSLVIVRDTNPQREAAGLIGYISMSMALAPMLGPVLGGVLDTAFGWRANFYFYAASGLALFVLCFFDLGETKPPAVAGAPAEKGQMRDLLTEPRFWAFSACTAFSTGAFFIFLTGAPLVAQSQFGVSTAELGIFIGTITGGFMTGSFVAGRLAPRFQPTTMMLAGRLIACLGLTAGIAALGFGAATPLTFFGSTVFVGFGNGVTMPSSNMAALSVRPNLTGSSAGLNGALVVSTGALLTSITGLVLPTEEPALMVLVLMLAASGAGLASVLVAMRLNGVDPQTQ